MALLAEEGDLEVEGSRNSGEQSDKPLFSDIKRDKRNRLDDKRGSIRSLPWSKSKDPAATDKPVKKGKQHSRNKSGSRTPPDSPKLALKGERVPRGNQTSPNVKSNRKSYSQLDDWSDDDDDDDDVGYTLSNEPALQASPLKSLLPQPQAETPHSKDTETPHSKNTETRQSTETPHSTDDLSPAKHSTVQFPVLFKETLSPDSTTTSVLSLNDLPSPLRDAFPLSSSSQPPGQLPHPPGQLMHPPQLSTEPSLPIADDWAVSDELRDKCVSQFKELSGSDGLLLGDKARQFFVLSKLPNQELSTIW